MSNQSGAPKQRGCLFYGCISLAALGLVILLCLAVGLYFAKRTLNTLINDYTEATPSKIEEAPYPEPKMRELRTRLNAFQDKIDAPANTESAELILTADDLNALIAANRDLKGKAFIMINDDQVKGQVSVPLPDIGPLNLRGRYLNGTAAFKVSLSNGRLDIRVEQVTVKDKPLPPIILTELKKQDLAQELQKDPDNAKMIEKLESVDVRDGKIVIRSKGGGSKEAKP